MPSTPKQMRAAGRELRRRREGGVEQEQIIGRGTRPFGAASEETLKAYASWPDPGEQREAAARELELRASRTDQHADPTRAFGTASAEDLEFFTTASDDEIRQRNGQPATTDAPAVDLETCPLDDFLALRLGRDR